MLDVQDSGIGMQCNAQKGTDGQAVRLLAAVINGRLIKLVITFEHGILLDQEPFPSILHIDTEDVEAPITSDDHDLRTRTTHGHHTPQRASRCLLRPHPSLG